MKVILAIICIIGIAWSIISRRNIERDEAAALKTPGKAKRLREQYGELIDKILQKQNHHIAFEREYDESIRFTNSNNQELFISWSYSGLNVACVQNSSLLKEWKFKKTDSTEDIYLEISNYFI